MLTSKYLYYLDLYIRPPKQNCRTTKRWIENPLKMILIALILIQLITKKNNQNCRKKLLQKMIIFSFLSVWVRLKPIYASNKTIDNFFGCKLKIIKLKKYTCVFLNGPYLSISVPMSPRKSDFLLIRFSKKGIFMLSVVSFYSVIFRR